MAFQELKKNHKAIYFFELALKADNKNIAAMNNLANSYKSLNHNDKAEELYERILKKEPNNIKYLNNAR